MFSCTARVYVFVFVRAAAAEVERLRLEAAAAEAERVRQAAAAAAAEAERVRLEAEAAAAAVAAAEAAAAAAVVFQKSHPTFAHIRAFNGTALAFSIIETWGMRAVNFGLQGNLPPNSDARLQLHWLDAECFKISAGADGGQFVSGDMNPTGPGSACVFRVVDGAFDGNARTTCYLQLPSGHFAQAEQSWRGSVLKNDSGNKGEWERWTIDTA